jgi:glucosyl-dolichyl phosphate glucuronosyltransferase
MNKKVSAIICTHNRSNYLKKALESLLKQDFPADHYEIIVVDNCSVDDTNKVVSRYSEGTRLRYLYEPVLGLSHARNTGWTNATGKYVAFLDDDAIASPDWLNKILIVFETIKPRPGCVGGKVVPIWEGPRPGWLSDWLLHGLALVDWSDHPHILADLSQEWLIGTNLAIPVEVLQKIGGFTHRLDRVGKSLLSSGDVFLEKQVAQLGYSVFYHPEILVNHHIMDARLDQSWFFRRYYWQGVSDAVMRILQDKPSSGKRFRDVLSQLRRLIRSPRTLLGIMSPPADPHRFTETCFSLITLGYIRGLITLPDS